MIIVDVYNYEKNQIIQNFALENTPAYEVGHFFVDSSDVNDCAGKVYIIRAVTHMKPDLQTGHSHVIIHVQKYDPSQVKSSVSKAMEKLKDIAERM